MSTANPDATSCPLTVALTGNPNCGKTTLFNALTGTHQRVGNWPGVTVERKTGSYTHSDEMVTLVDLPGTYGLDADNGGLDEEIARNYLSSNDASVVLNVLDASSLARGLYLTTELLELSKPVVVALNMMDSADRQGIHIDVFALSQRLGCPVVPLVASRGDGVGALKDALELAKPSSPVVTGDPVDRFRFIDAILSDCQKEQPVRSSVTRSIDNLVLNRFLALPIFGIVMYLMFMFSINIGSAFIDFFDLTGQALFVQLPTQLLTAVHAPDWLTAFIANGIGGGLQLVGTFIPVIGALFLALSFLEDTGYMARVAFVIDRMTRKLGLPGKAFVPLIVGFGCNVPSVMATRTLDNQSDRILTSIMAPYMSCGARLTVYALFAAAFFPTNGHNVVFALYLIGIAAAIVSALAVRRYLVPSQKSHFLLELPTYHLPTIKGLLLQTWQRLKGFVTRAGKAIVAVVIVLNVVNSLGVDGSFGNENKETSALSAIGKAATPLFAPMGIKEDNWPATVGIFTGIFAKEVVVGTLDALYAPASGPDESSPLDTIKAAVASVPANLKDLGGTLTDPLGLELGDLTDTSAAAAEQDVAINTVTAMQQLFDGQLGAFCYLLFVLLYIPCVATVAVIYKEHGAGWAAFSTAWSILLAYCSAVLCYQLGTFNEHAGSSAAWCLGILAIGFIGFYGLIRMGPKPVRLIPVTALD